MARPAPSIRRHSFRYKKVLGAYYRAYLANLLETELGFTLIRKGDSFEIDGRTRRPDQGSFSAPGRNPGLP